MTFRPSTLGTATVVAALTASMLIAAPGSARAQNVTIDEGTFDLTLDGRAIGTETFAIRRIGSGEDARILANAVIELEPGARLPEMRPVLEVEVDGLPLAYQNKIAGDDESEVTVRAADRRYVALIRSSAGERERELRATPGAVFLEGDVAHQYHFLARAATAGATIPVVVPRTGEQVRARVTDVSQATVQIGDRSVQARRVRLDVAGEAREVWIDQEDRILRLAIPSRNFQAERQAL